ncbi:MAG: ATP-binding protein [Pseudobdellovibrio sp.]
MLGAIETDLAIAIKQDWNHEELISKLLQVEKDCRDENFIKKKIKLAHFKRNAFLDEFDLLVKCGVTKNQLQDLMSLNWLEQARPIVFVGQTDVGKSYLADALGRFVCSRRKTVLLKEATELFLMINEGRRLNRYLSTRKR